MAALCMEADGKGWGWMPSGFAKKGEYYWKAVATEFNNNAPKNSHKRTIRQLMKHWGDVKRDITKFSGAYARAMNARSSGQSDDMVLKAAHEFFKNGNNGRSFIYEYLWEVAKEMPKWRRIIKEESTSKRTKVSKSGAYTSSSNQDTEGETMSREVRPEGQKKAKARLKGAGKSAAPSPLSNQPSQNMVMYHEAMTMKAKSARAKKYNTYLKMLAIDTSNFNEKEKTRHDSILDQIAKDLAED
ncbi:glutathione S-transferase T3-like [Sorghum bicolor]|uniref:glutathione S-transferase T3-like n=1 Tax=Sorghum bicolor TaxID=4558 RepID=UPI000B4252B0|nr:glutathione S-transferase T3-like [Sorghum bicolor]|eukprot:XP_021307800.1 glutathione S-transferase T3-like [Sorghum bicolor]